MKKHLLHTILPVILFLAMMLPAPVSAQTLYSENFDYQEGMLLTSAGWSAYSQPGVNPVMVSGSGLSFPGYALSNIGNAVRLKGSGESVMRRYAEDPAPDGMVSYSVYVSFMVNISQPVNASVLSISGTTDAYKRARLFTTSATPYQLGLSFGSATPVLTSESFIPGKTYLVVIRYQVNEGNCNDAVSMYIFDDEIPAQEPAIPSVGPLTDASLTDILPVSLLLQQNCTAQDLAVDGIRAGNDWISVVTSDTEPPRFSAGYPSATAITATSLDLNVSLNEAGMAYYIAVAKGSAAPSAAEVIAGVEYGTVTPAAAGSMSVPAENTVYTVAVGSLTASTDYDIYVVAQDDETTPNIQSQPSLITVTTLRSPDATLSDLRVDGMTVTGFSSLTTGYTMIYEPGTTRIPEVTFTLSDPEASATVTPATDLTGDDAARTAVVEVTAYDGVTKSTYSVSFDPILIIADLTALRAVPADNYDRVYQVSGEVVVTAVSHTAGFMFIQDLSQSGMFVPDNNSLLTTLYYNGDGITGLRGRLSDIEGMMAFIPYSDPGAATSRGNTIDKQTVTADELAAAFESYESELVAIKGATFTGADGIMTFATGVSYPVTTVSGAVIVRPLIPESNLNGTVVPYMADVTGVATWADGAAGIMPVSRGDLSIYSSDASLSRLVYNRTIVPDFYPEVFDYQVVVSPYAVMVPKVTASATSSMATLTVVQAVSLDGTAEERTAVITVVSQDKAFTNTYTLTFSKPVIAEKSVVTAEVYPVPATGTVTVKNVSEVTLMEVFSASGAKLQTLVCGGETEKDINIGGYPSGFYFIKCTVPEGIFMVKFIVK